MPAVDRRRRALACATALLAASLWLVPANAGAQAADGAGPATGAIRFYQQHLSSLRHGHCRFTPSCSEYAAQAIARYGLVEGSARAADRLMRCNESAEGFYPRGALGTLEDPVDATVTAGAWAPAWLLPAPAPGLPPLPDTLGSAPRERIAETARFAHELEQRGDIERAATEYQRTGSLAASREAQAWGFVRSGECAFAARRWPDAERAFLAAGMLAPAPDGRARAAFMTAAGRFGAGDFAAGERVLDVPALAQDGDSASPAIGADRVATLRGLCAMGRGDWSRAADAFAGAAAQAGDPAVAGRIRLLGAFARQGPGLSRRSPGLAEALSAVVPGAGPAYAGRARDGVRHLLFNAAMIATVVSFARHGEGPAAYVAGTFAFPFYAGNVLGAGEAARRHDRFERTALIERALRESSR
jgi:putative membrane protein insertion efficiency factor